MEPTTDRRQQLREQRAQRIRSVERRQIIWPITIAMIIIASLAILLIALPGDAGNNLVVFLLLLCPMAIILYAVYVVMALTVLGFGKVNDKGYEGLEKANDLAEQMRSITSSTARRINEQSIRFNSALAPASKAMNAISDSDGRNAAASKSKVDGKND